MARLLLLLTVMSLALQTALAGLGESVADFRLPDYHGQQRALSELAGPRGTVLVFLGVECPLAKLYAPRLAHLAAQYEARGVRFIALDSNRQDLPTEMGHYAQRHGLKFPFLKDLQNEIADRLGAQRTPEVFLLDHELRLRYRGRIDDQYQPGVQGARAKQEDLKQALEDLLADRPIRQPTTEAVGCLIGREPKQPARPPAGEPVTWSKQIAPIFQRHCQDCHRPGEIGPMPLLTYQDIQGWEEMIREVVSQGRMPPWHANPQYGQFANDLRLSDEEKKLIFAWLDQQAPEGNPADLPPPVNFPEGWHIPPPDQIVYMSAEPFSVPAEGTVEYQWFVADPGFREDRWVKAAECRPGNRAVVHHVTVYYKPPGVPFSLRTGRRINLLAGYAPGKVHYVPIAGTAFYLPAGTQLIFEMHYTPNGTPQTDRSSIGLVFARPEEVEKQIYCVMNANDRFAIPPGADDYPVESSYMIDEDSLLYFMSPHMHLRGKSFRFDLIHPAGRRETLLDVPRFEFGWQTNYFLAEPKLLPKGSIVHCTAHFDNSEHNPANPDPRATVRWGDQTWEEMMIGTIAIAPVHQNLRTGLGPGPRTFDPSQWWYPQYTVALVLAGILAASVAGGSLAWRFRRRQSTRPLSL
jgi:peroxiredoxin/mono/diheme cytochrome c family protein